MSTNRTSDGRNLPTYAASALGDTENGDRVGGLVNFLWTGGAYARQRHAFDGVPGTGVAAVGQVAYGSNAQFNAMESASAANDADAGHKFMPAGGMVWNGTTWQRARGPYREVLLPLADRTAPDSNVYSATSPSTNTYDFTSAIFCLRVTAISGTPSGTEGLTFKVLMPDEGNQALVASEIAAAKFIRATGRYLIAVGPGVAAQATGPAAQTLPTGSVTTMEAPVLAAPVPLPPRVAFQVFHRGGTTLTYTYDVSVSYSR
jgi:hypothetical protein